MRTACGPKTGCHGCGGDIPRGRRVWCSNACALRVVTNHDWQSARAAVIKRDDHRCVICGEDDKGDKAREYHRRCGKTFLEVNHMQPVNGRRKSWDCQNHQDNLETLCHDCHGAVTKQQRDAGLIGGRLPHIFVVITRDPALMQCKKCGAAHVQKTAFHPRVRIGSRVWISERYREVCPGPTLSSRKRLRRKRVRR